MSVHLAAAFQRDAATRKSIESAGASVEDGDAKQSAAVEPGGPEAPDTGGNHSFARGEWMLRQYAFSMSPGVLAKIAQFMDQLALGDGKAMTQYTRKQALYDRHERRRSVGRSETQPLVISDAGSE